MGRTDFARIDAPAQEFCFQLEEGGKVYRMPALGSLPLKSVRELLKLKGADDAEALDAIAVILDRYCKGLSAKLTLDQFNAVLDEWFAASGVTLGE